MGYVLEPTASIRNEIRRVVTERLTDALAILDQIDGTDPEDLERAVHDVRKRCKEARAVARLVRSSIGDEFDPFDDMVRGAAAALAPIRDAHAVLATFDRLRGHSTVRDDPVLARVRIGQARIAEETALALRTGDSRLALARDRLDGARARVERWEVGNDVTSLVAGIEDTYRRGRRSMRRAHSAPTDERVHEWRKAVKNLWYQARLFEQAAPSVMQPFIANVDGLAEALGDDHDLAVLLHRISTEPRRFGGTRDVELVTRLARGVQDDLRRRAFRGGATIYAESPRAFAKRMRTYWSRTKRYGPELPTGGITELADRTTRFPAGSGRNVAHMGTMVEFASNGNNAAGYLAMPEGGSGPGVIVVQEWWGLDSGIKEMADRLAAAGFVALVPDLYHGELAEHTEMDKAGELMQALPPDRAGRDMSGAVDFLADHDATTGEGIGVMGFCMGGMLTFILAALRPDKVKAAVPFYGFPQGDDQPDYSVITAAIQGHMAENDDFFPPAAAKELEATLHALGKDITMTVYPGSGHAFMAPHNALGTQDQDLYDHIWPQATAFLHEHLG